MGRSYNKNFFSSGPFWTDKYKTKDKYISISNILHLLSAPASIPRVEAIWASLVVESKRFKKVFIVSNFCLIVDSSFHPSRALTRSFEVSNPSTWTYFCYQPVCQSTRKSVALSVETTASPSIIPIRMSYVQSILHPITSSLTCQSVTPSVSPKIHPSDHPSPSDYLYTILPNPSGCPTSSDHLYNNPASPLDRPSMPDHLYDKPLSLSVCPSPSDCLTATTICPPIRLSSYTIHCKHDSSQSLAVMNGEQSRKSKKFRRVFTNYDLLLCALDASSIYLSESRCVAPPISGEEFCI